MKVSAWRATYHVAPRDTTWCHVVSRDIRCIWWTPTPTLAMDLFSSDDLSLWFTSKPDARATGWCRPRGESAAHSHTRIHCAGSRTVQQTLILLIQATPDGRPAPVTSHQACREKCHDKAASLADLQRESPAIDSEIRCPSRGDLTAWAVWKRGSATAEVSSGHTDAEKTGRMRMLLVLMLLSGPLLLISLMLLLLLPLMVFSLKITTLSVIW